MYPMVYRVASAHEEGGERVYSVNTQKFLGNDGALTGLELVDVELKDGKFEPIPGSERVIPADLVFLALGFSGPQKSDLLNQLGVELDQRGNIVRDQNFQTTVPGLFVAGDAGRGQSLIVWAIAEGRSAAAGVDKYLSGRETLPSPISPTTRSLSV
jgi:glutamate synthase (NADPH/NADH) small chain